MCVFDASLQHGQTGCNDGVRDTLTNTTYYASDTQRIDKVYKDQKGLNGGEKRNKERQGSTN